MNADGLLVPRGVFHYGVTNGVREIIDYDIANDAFICRYDTIINGVKHSHVSIKPEGIDSKVWFSQEGKIAMKKFKEAEGS